MLLFLVMALLALGLFLARRATPPRVEITATPAPCEEINVQQSPDAAAFACWETMLTAGLPLCVGESALSAWKTEEARTTDCQH